MNKLFSKKFLKLLACVLVVTQSVIFALVATFYLSKSYINKITGYPNNSLNITIKNTDEKKQKDIKYFLYQEAEKNHLFYVRKDIILKSGGDVSSIELGVYGDVVSNIEKLKFSYLGSRIVTQDNLNKLLQSTNKNATLGLGISSVDMIEPIPSFVFGENVVIKKLDDVIENSKTINGQYKIVGLTSSNKESFLEGLADVSGVDRSTFTDNLSGQYIDNSFQEAVLIILLIVHSLVLLSLLFYLTIDKLNLLGKLVLQGWSNILFYHTHAIFVAIGFITVFASLIYGLVLTNFTFKTMLFFSSMLLIGIINFILMLILVIIASIPIFIVKPINAIRDRLPKKLYIGVAAILYALFSVGLTSMTLYIDGPYKKIEENVKISQRWKSVEDMNILKSVSVGNDTSSFTHQSKDFAQDFYNWYKSIEEKDGVSLVKVSKFTSEMLNNFRVNKVYTNVPEQEMCIISASPSYLKSQGVELDTSVIEQAKSGKRVYLMPVELIDKSKVKSWLSEKDTKGIQDGDINTAFNHNREFEFITYNQSIDLFTWTTKNNEELIVKNPIILALTSENMIYKESESLYATGLDNNYIKLTDTAKNLYASTEYLSKFNLDDNHITFDTVSKFIDGLQKELWQTIYMFGVLLLTVTFIVVTLLLIILSTFELVNREPIAVKQFLGYSSFSIYKLPIIMVGLIMVSELLIVIVCRSTIGIVYLSTTIIFQVFLAAILIIKNRVKNTINVFKS